MSLTQREKVINNQHGTGWPTVRAVKMEVPPSSANVLFSRQTSGCYLNNSSCLERLSFSFWMFLDTFITFLQANTQNESGLATHTLILCVWMCEWERINRLVRPEKHDINKVHISRVYLSMTGSAAITTSVCLWPDVQNYTWSAAVIKPSTNEANIYHWSYDISCRTLLHPVKVWEIPQS